MTKQEKITQFKQDYMVDIKFAPKLFDYIVLYEEKFQKEIKDFTYEEAGEFFYAYTTTNANVFHKRNAVIKSWIAYFYCAECHSVFDDLTDADFVKWIHNTHLFTREEFVQFVNQLFNYTDKAILEALWEGFDPREINQFTKQTVSIDRTVKIDGKIMKLTDRLYDFMQEAFDEHVYTTYTVPPKTMPRIITDRLIKVGVNASVNTQNLNDIRALNAKMRNTLVPIGRYFNIADLTRTNIEHSGLIHKVKQGMAVQNIGLRDFLRTTEGKAILQQYHLNTNHFYYVQNFIKKYREYF